MIKISKELFDAIPDGGTIALGIGINSHENLPDHVYLTSARYNDLFKYVVIKGFGDDWTLYLHWFEYSFQYVEQHGDKISINNLKKILEMPKELWDKYRP